MLSFLKIIGILLTIALFNFGFYWAFKKLGFEPKVYLPITISIISLIVSLFAAFKDDLLPFNLSVLSDSVIITSSDKTVENIEIILPISFINNGHGAGVVEWIAVKIKNKNTNSIKLYTPVAEIEMATFIKNKRKLHAENIETGFSSFIISSKESIKKHILLMQEMENKNYPYSSWEIGEYQLDIYVKTNKKKNPQLLKSLSIKLDQDSANRFLTGYSVYHIVREIIL